MSFQLTILKVQPGTLMGEQALPIQAGESQSVKRHRLTERMKLGPSVPDLDILIEGLTGQNGWPSRSRSEFYSRSKGNLRRCGHPNRLQVMRTSAPPLLRGSQEGRKQRRARRRRVILVRVAEVPHDLEGRSKASSRPSAMRAAAWGLRSLIRKAGQRARSSNAPGVVAPAGR